MPTNAAALTVVLALGLTAFYIGGRIGGPFIIPREFVVWRNAWFAATVVAFLSNNFLAFAIVAAMICLYARAAHAATLGFFFLLLFAVPLGNVTIEGFGGINMLFVINNGRLLTVVLLLPILFAMRSMRDRNNTVYSLPDWLVISYVLLLISLEFRRSDLTNVMRVALLDTLDILVPYLAFSRAVTGISDLRRILLGFVIATLPISLAAPFEFAKSWHLYAAIADNWGNSVSFVRREGILRAAGSAADGIVLGYVIMVATGCLLGLWLKTNRSRTSLLVALIIFAAASVATLSRGPWLGIAALIVVYSATSPRPFTDLGKLAAILFILLPLLLLTPAANFLPFIGSVDTGTVSYRELLFENALIVIEHNPWLGSVDYLSTPEMKQLLQGEGIIDLVNTYVQVALFSGIVGLGLFTGFFATILIGLWRVIRLYSKQSSDVADCARTLTAILVAILVTVGTVSSIDFIPYIYWSFAGLSVALIRISHRQQATVTHDAYGGHPGRPFHWRSAAITTRLLLAVLVAFSHLQFSLIRSRKPHSILRNIPYAVRSVDH